MALSPFVTCCRLLLDGGDAEGELRVRLAYVPDLHLVVADAHQHVRIPGMQSVMQDLEGLDNALLVMVNG
jgi:hypothetical protein